MWQAAAQDQVACWTNHKIFHQFKIYCGWAGDGREMVTSVRVKVIMFELGSLGQGGQFGVKCVNVFRQFYQNWLARLRGELSGDIYDRDPPQQPFESWVNILPRNAYIYLWGFWGSFSLNSGMVKDRQVQPRVFENYYVMLTGKMGNFQGNLPNLYRERSKL